MLFPKRRLGRVCIFCLAFFRFWKEVQRESLCFFPWLPGDLPSAGAAPPCPVSIPPRHGPDSGHLLGPGAPGRVAGLREVRRRNYQGALAGRGPGQTWYDLSSFNPLTFYTMGARRHGAGRSWPTGHSPERREQEARSAGSDRQPELAVTQEDGPRSTPFSRPQRSYKPPALRACLAPRTGRPRPSPCPGPEGLPGLSALALASPEPQAGSWPAMARPGKRLQAQPPAQLSPTSVSRPGNRGPSGARVVRTAR